MVASVNGERMVQQWLAAYVASTGSLDTLKPQPPLIRPASVSRTGPRGEPGQTGPIRNDTPRPGTLDVDTG